MFGVSKTYICIFLSRSMNTQVLCHYYEKGGSRGVSVYTNEHLQHLISVKKAIMPK